MTRPPTKRSENAKTRKSENAKSDLNREIRSDKVVPDARPLRVFALSRFRVLFGSFPVSQSARRSRLLLTVLIGLALVYVALLPTLRRMAAETEHLQRRNAAQQAEAARLAGLRRALAEARAKVQRDPR